jgi:D-sedoheptulose 7-phosphate isomerase
MSDEYLDAYLGEIKEIADTIDRSAINKAADFLAVVREKGGRLFILGVGGSAAHAGNALADFRKSAGILTYVPTDNIAELTALTNDDGWDKVFVKWLEEEKLSANDAVLVFSVGGGNAEKNVSMNIVHALNYAKEKGAKVIGIVSRDGGHTAKVADACILVPVVNPDRVGQHAKSWQAIVWQAIASHPKLKR